MWCLWRINLEPSLNILKQMVTSCKNLAWNQWCSALSWFFVCIQFLYFLKHEWVREREKLNKNPNTIFLSSFTENKKMMKKKKPWSRIVRSPFHVHMHVSTDFLVHFKFIFLFKRNTKNYLRNVWFLIIFSSRRWTNTLGCIRRTNPTNFLAFNELDVLCLLL